MDSDTLSLIISNTVVVVLFAISEALPFIPSPYNGIVHAILTALEQPKENSSTN